MWHERILSYTIKEGPSAKCRPNEGLGKVRDLSHPIVKGWKRAGTFLRPSPDFHEGQTPSPATES